MAGETNYGAATALTFTNLNSQGNGDTDQSAAINNSTVKALDYMIYVKIQTSTGTGSTTGAVNFYIASSIDDGTDYTGGASGSDATYAPTPDTAANLLQLPRERIPIDASDTTAYTFEYAFTVAKHFGGWCPEYFSFVAENATGDALGATCSVEYQALKTEDV